MNQSMEISNNIIENLIFILKTSKVLRIKLPHVRRLALLETIKKATDIEQVINIFLENLSTSPYIENDDKTNLAELVFTQNWSSLISLLECNNNNLKQNKLREFRIMVTTIFCKSKKIVQLEPLRRNLLGKAILHQTSIEGLKNLAFNSLQESQVFSNETKNLIANDIIDNRYDLLLLPNRFDCEELPRTDYQNQINSDLDDCPICLGQNVINTKLPCNHAFCNSCIQNWSEQNNNPSCPICRRNYYINQFQYI